EEGVTFSAAVPTVWMDVFEVLARRGTPLPALRMLISGGGPLPGGLLDLADELGLPLTHSYGMTEAAPLTNVNRPKVGLDDEPAGARRRRRLRQGLLVPGLQMRILDASGVEVPADGRTAGELLLRGPWVAEGYVDDERSSSSFVDGWYRTGDFVTVDREGYLLIVDRRQDLIKSGGEWISSIELESAFSEHDDVARAAAIAVPDERWQERPLVFVQAQPGREIDEAELRSWLEQRLPRWWIPERIEIVETIPTTTVGKIDKKALRQRHRIAGEVVLGKSNRGDI
ncbi:MAG TPA: AMP-binding protein, partial [Solirubrobacterales bacterium]